ASIVRLPSTVATDFGTDDNGRAMRATAGALLLAAAPPAGRRKSPDLRGAVEQQVAKTSLAGLCDAYTQAERHLPDPLAAYEDVRDHYTTLCPPLIKMRAGVEGLEAGARSPFWLRFARHDYGLAGWSCPSLDRLLLQI